MENIPRLTLKRLRGDFKLLKKDPHEYFEAYPDETNVLVWYFIVKGPEFSDFAGGYYLGKIMHSPDYPLKAPDFMVLTPNGRFTEDKKICLSNSSYHSNEWSAMWNIKAILTGFLSIMLDDNENGISHIHMSKYERQILAKQSVLYNKQRYPGIIKNFSRFLDENGEPRVEPVKTEPTPAVERVEPVVVASEPKEAEAEQVAAPETATNNAPTEVEHVAAPETATNNVLTEAEPKRKSKTAGKVVKPKSAKTAKPRKTATKAAKETKVALKVRAKAAPKPKPAPKTQADKLIQELDETLE